MLYIIFKKEKIDQEIYELLKRFKLVTKDEKLIEYTLVGGFFEFNTFIRFIDDVIHGLHKNIILGRIASVVDNFNYKIE